MEKNLTRILVLFFATLVIGGVVIYTQISMNSVATVQNKGSRVIDGVAGIAIGGAYELTDHTGAVRTDKDFAGQYKLIYFGFTYCPAICPTELQKITAVMAQLPQDISAKIQPLFITVDPQRDTVDVLKDYISLFHERIIGLTGTPEQIDTVKKAYRVFAKQVQEEGMTEYTMDHSSYIYFMSPDDQLLGMYRIQDTPGYIVNDVVNPLKLN
jgi:protein SCO1/2